MGFWVMCLSALLGLILIVLGFSSQIKQRSLALKWGLVIIGVVLILFAVFLGLPH